MFPVNIRNQNMAIQTAKNSSTLESIFEIFNLINSNFILPNSSLH